MIINILFSSKIAFCFSSFSSTFSSFLTALQFHILSTLPGPFFCCLWQLLFSAHYASGSRDNKETELSHCSQNSGGCNKEIITIQASACSRRQMHKVLPVATRCWNLEEYQQVSRRQNILEDIRAKLRSLKLAW